MQTPVAAPEYLNRQDFWVGTAEIGTFCSSVVEVSPGVVNGANF